MRKLSRRDFIGIAGVAGVTAAISSRAPAHTTAPTATPMSHTATPNPTSAPAARRVKIINIKEVKVKEPVTFEYPETEKAALIDMGRPVPGGVGPNNSIVAFSTYCSHMGCRRMDWFPEKEIYRCKCHLSIFEVAQRGRAIEGPASLGLPEIALEVDGAGDIYAVGVASGLVYGRASNL